MDVIEDVEDAEDARSRSPPPPPPATRSTASSHLQHRPPPPPRERRLRSLPVRFNPPRARPPRTMRRPPRVTVVSVVVVVPNERSRFDQSIDSLIRRSNDRSRPTARDRRLDATRSIVSISTISHSRDRSRSRSTTPRSSSPAASQPRSNDRGHRAGGGVPHVRSHRGFRVYFRVGLLDVCLF